MKSYCIHIQTTNAVLINNLRQSIPCKQQKILIANNENAYQIAFKINEEWQYHEQSRVETQQDENSSKSTITYQIPTEEFTIEIKPIFKKIKQDEVKKAVKPENNVPKVPKIKKDVKPPKKVKIPEKKVKAEKIIPEQVKEEKGVNPQTKAEVKEEEDWQAYLNCFSASSKENEIEHIINGLQCMLEYLPILI